MCHDVLLTLELHSHALRASDDWRRRKALRQTMRELQALRAPSARLSRKHLKTVNGALVAVGEPVHPRGRRVTSR